MAQIIIIFLIVQFIIWLIPGIENFVQHLFKQIKQRFSTNKNAAIFETNYIEVKTFYVKEYNTTPCISFINNLDVSKAYAYINTGAAGKVLGIYQRNYYSWQHKRQEFSTTVFKLENKVMIEVGDEYAEVLFANNNYKFANELMELFSSYKAPQKEEPYEINIITQNSSGLDLKQLEIKPTVLDIDLYYNDDFKAVDEIIKQRLEKENDKGIISVTRFAGYW